MEIKNKLTKNFFILLVVFLFLGFVSSGQLDSAKKSVDNFYKYSQEKNLDSYLDLFDRDYLIGLYGSDYIDFFMETFNYFEITDYKIKYQYYTESDNSLTIFYNLKSNTIVDGEKVKMDNDLVAFFVKKSDGLKIKFVMLAENFVSQMNKEIIVKATSASVNEEFEDFGNEASLESNYEDMETAINKTKNKHSKKNFLWIFILAMFGYIGYYFYKNKGKFKSLKSSFYKNSRTCWEKLEKYYKLKIAPFVRNLWKGLVSFSKNVWKKIVKFYDEKIIPFFKKIKE